MRYRKKARTRTHEVIHWPDTLMRSQVALRYVGHYEPLSTLSDRNPSLPTYVRHGARKELE